MAKLTTQNFIDQHLGGASQYDEANVRSMLDSFVMRATDAVDADLRDAGMPAYAVLDARQQGIYNRVAGELVWLQLQAHQGSGAVADDAWDAALGGLEDAFVPRASVVGGTVQGVATAAQATGTGGTGAVDSAQVEAIVRGAVAQWALAGNARPGGIGTQGPQGEAGPQGPAGPAGPQGETGPAGPQGPQGPQGTPGSGGTPGGLNQAQVEAVVKAEVADEAETGNTDRWPASKLQQSSATQGGIITAAQWTAIDNSIDATTLHDQPHLDNSQIDGGVAQDSVLIDDASVVGARSLKEIYFNELDKRWAAVDRANYLGTWQSGGQYRVGDVVKYGDMFFIAKSTRSGADTTAPEDDDEWLDITGGGGVAAGVNLIFTYTTLPAAASDSPVNVYVEEDAIYHRRTITGIDTTDITFVPSATNPFSVASGNFTARTGLPANIRRYIESIQAVYENTLSGDRSTYNFRRGNWVAYLSPEFTAAGITLTVGTATISLQRAVGTTRTYDGRTYTRYQSPDISNQANSATILTSPYMPRIQLPFNVTQYTYDKVVIGPAGPQGEQGQKGDRGERGPAGPQGIQGVQGEQGDDGERGATGDTGPQGNPGPQGQKGDTGDTGAKGDKGDKGDTGDTGPAQSNANIDARIAAFARTGATVNIPDARLPAILRGLPSSFGTAGQVLQVNSGASALEFADAASGGAAITDYIRTGTALPTATRDSADDFYVRNDAVYRKVGFFGFSIRPIGSGNGNLRADSIPAEYRRYITANSTVTFFRNGSYSIGLATPYTASTYTMVYSRPGTQRQVNITITRQSGTTVTENGITYVAYTATGGLSPVNSGGSPYIFIRHSGSYSYTAVDLGAGGLAVVDTLPTASASSPTDVYVRGDGVYHKTTNIIDTRKIYLAVTGSVLDADIGVRQAVRGFIPADVAEMMGQIYIYSGGVLCYLNTAVFTGSSVSMTLYRYDTLVGTVSLGRQSTQRNAYGRTYREYSLFTTISGFAQNQPVGWRIVVPGTTMRYLAVT